jgi:hypothetical protein
VGNLEGLPVDRIATGALTQIVRDRGYFGADTLLLGTSADNTVLRSAGYVAIADVGQYGIVRIYPKGSPSKGSFRDTEADPEGTYFYRLWAE